MRPGVKIVALMPWLSNSSISRQMPTRPPNSPLASCIGGSFSSAAQQHGVEIGGEVDRDARALGPGAVLDDLVARAVVGGLGLERGDVAVESVGEFGRGVHG